MRRLALAIVVAFLTFSVSGASALLVDEPCAGAEQAAESDRDCPPTCVRCGCCAQAAEPTGLSIQSALTSLQDLNVAARPVPRSQPNEIFHVPRHCPS